MKRFLATLTTLLLSFTGLVAFEAPAHATSTSLSDVFGNGTITTEVGQSVSWDWMSCGGRDASQLFFDSGSLPTGLTWDNGVDYNSTPTGLVTGTPTTPGTWTLSGLNCYFYVGARADNVGGGSWNAGSVTITVLAPVSPTPTISLVSLQNSDCELMAIGSVPVTPLAGSMTLTLTNGTNTATIGLANYAANQIISERFSLTNLSALLTHQHVTSLQFSDNPNGFTCGQTITGRLSYQHDSDRAATASDTAFTVPNNGSIVLIPKGDANCTISAVITIDHESSSSLPLKASIVDSDNHGVVMQLGNYTFGVPFIVEIPINAMATLSNSQVTSSTLVGVSACGSAFHGVLGFQSQDSATGAASLDSNTVHPTTAQTVVGIAAPKALKFKTSTVLPVVTVAGNTATVTATGACSAVSAAAGTKVEGKRLKVASVIVTAGKVAGNCNLSFASPAVGFYGALASNVVVKVSKTGK